MKFNYIKNSKKIYTKSFDILRNEINLCNFPNNIHMVITRLVHSCGMVDIVDDINFSYNFINSIKSALKKNYPILCDCEMVKSGIIKRFLPINNQLICTLNNIKTPSIANNKKITHTAAAVTLWKPFLKNSIIVIGNSPTALFHLLEIIIKTNIKPAAIIGFPVGFVGAAESKKALIEQNLNIDYITLKGRRGGSAMASAVLNAILMDLTND